MSITQPHLDHILTIFQAQLVFAKRSWNVYHD
jgi:hypothetical protein